MRAVALVLVLSGCTIQSNKYPTPDSLPDSWLVDRLRILSVDMEPPEVTTGQTSVFEALVVDPTTTDPQTVVWFACDSSQASGAGCNTDLGKLRFDLPPDQLRAEGVAGITVGGVPVLQPQFTPDPSLLSGLTDAQKLEGVEVTVEIAAFPASVLQDTAAATGDTGLDFNQVEVAYKRLVVSDAATPNQNPVISAFTVDGNPIPNGSTVTIDANQVFTLGITIPDADVETYDYTDSNGAVEQRVEAPYVDFYTTEGSLEQDLNLYPNLHVPFLAPNDLSGTSGTWWAVVRDRRGGMAWRAQPFTIR